MVGWGEWRAASGVRRVVLQWVVSGVKLVSLYGDPPSPASTDEQQGGCARWLGMSSAWVGVRGCWACAVRARTVDFGKPDTKAPPEDKNNRFRRARASWKN